MIRLSSLSSTRSSVWPSGVEGSTVTPGEWASGACSLQCRDLGDPTSGSLRAREARREKVPQQLRRELRPDHARAEAKHVHVVVFDSLSRGEAVVTHRGANAGDLVGGDPRTNAAATDQD